MKSKLSLAAALTVIVLAGPCFARTYTTSFPATENPISEGGSWVNGLATGMDWGDVRTMPALAFGTSTTTSCGVGTGDCNDSTAVVTGTWGTDQSICAHVFLGAPNRDVGFKEVELRFNTTVAAHSITGYEWNYSIRDDGSRYSQFVRWNGALNDFTILTSTATPPVLANGDELCGSNSGGSFTLTNNGTTVLTFTDSTYTAASPGIGFFNESGTVGDNAQFGFTDFSATDGINSSVAPLPWFFAALMLMVPLK